ncbi:MAG: transposase [Candidatus Portnoybacteria bacterium]|nr:transposase [Candidatus Portnoybacteria bacterium]
MAWLCKKMSQEIYHILNRGVDKRDIFADKQDYFRFIHDSFEFNDEDLVDTAYYYFEKHKKDNNLLERKSRKLLVNIHAFCLMPNHYHLLMSEIKEGGISKFMHKLNKGYSRYFNIRHKRKGTLFEGRYKSILVGESNYFLNLPYYIHLNPLNFPSVTDRKLLLDIFGGEGKYQQSINKWLKEMETGNMRELMLE